MDVKNNIWEVFHQQILKNCCQLGQRLLKFTSGTYPLLVGLLLDDDIRSICYFEDDTGRGFPY